MVRYKLNCGCLRDGWEATGAITPVCLVVQSDLVAVDGGAWGKAENRQTIRKRMRGHGPSFNISFTIVCYLNSITRLIVINKEMTSTNN